MLRKLIENFETRIDLPIEIGELRDCIVQFGVQDRIIFSGENLDTGKLRGALYQWTEHNSMYGEPIWTTLIIYPKNEELELQRVICAKELVHLCDKKLVKTKTKQEVAELAEKVVGPFETDKATQSDLVASLDKLAQYLSLTLLFPKAARDQARKKLTAGEVTLEEIAEWAVLPVDAIALSLDDAWEAIIDLVVKLGNGDLE